MTDSLALLLTDEQRAQIAQEYIAKQELAADAEKQELDEVNEKIAKYQAKVDRLVKRKQELQKKLGVKSAPGTKPPGVKKSEVAYAAELAKKREPRVCAGCGKNTTYGATYKYNDERVCKKCRDGGMR